MNRKRSLTPLYWGIGLFAVGLVFTLFTLGPLARYETQVVWAVMVLLGLGGLAALAFGALRPERWWYFIPGFLLLGAAAVVYLGAYRGARGTVLAGILFVALGLGHLLIFLTDRVQRWWAWISAGSFFVLTAVVILASGLSPTVAGALLFFGLSLVFYLLYLFTPSSLHRWWVLALATVLILVAAFTFTVGQRERVALARYWPLALILVGVGLSVWTLARRFAAEPPPAIPTPPEPVAPSVAGVTPVPEDLPERVTTSTPPPPAEDAPAEEAQGSA